MRIYKLLAVDIIRHEYKHAQEEISGHVVTKATRAWKVLTSRSVTDRWAMLGSLIIQTLLSLSMEV